VILKDGEIHYQKGFGFRDIHTGKSATPKTIYCIGSVTKFFTALAIMQLRDQGLLSLGDPVEKFVPFKIRPKGEVVRIKHLLSHTSGLPSLGYAEATLSMITGASSNWFPISNLQDLLVFMNGAEDWVISSPGEKHAYLNEGYIILGGIIEKASGLNYADYVQSQILKPLRMDRSTFFEEDVRRESDVATPYITSEKGEKIPTKYPYGQLLSDGGLMSNALDMANLLKMVFSEGAFNGRSILSSKSLREMMEPKIKTQEKPIAGEDYRYYCFGLRMKSNFLGYNLLHHSGSVFGSSAYMGFIPECKTGVIILSNGGYFLEPVGEYALAIMLDKDPLEIPFHKRMMILEELTGTYTSFKDTLDYKVSRNGGVLQIESSFGSFRFITPLIPVDIGGEIKEFMVYGLDTITPVQFIREKENLFMIYERNKLKKTGRS
ncbi:serine hydrolase, partial [Candidatus Bathyarchaeota archaeon]|nr:serine hydrolase [Candidatus Bathyarchaeota archaeon]